MSVIAFQEIFSSSLCTFSYTVLLIHGILGSGDDFMDYSRSLAQSLSSSSDWRMVVVDLRNHGRSADIEGLYPPHDTQNTARDLANLFKSLGGGWPDVVVGHSFGGKVALQYALSCLQGDYGHSVHSPKQVWLIDVGPGGVDSNYPGVLNDVLLALLKLPSPIPSQKYVADYLLNLGFSNYYADWLSGLLKKSGEDGTLKFTFNIEPAREMFNSGLKADYWGLVENLPKGMDLSVVRTESESWPPDLVERLEQLANRGSHGSRSGKVFIDVVPNSGHWIYKDQPQKLLEIMTPRIASLLGPNSKLFLPSFSVQSMLHFALSRLDLILQ